jgi:drug/metabolite transporter (DMT)-like permease
VGSLYSRGAPLPKRPLVSAGLASLCGGILLTVYSVVSGEIGEAVWTTDAILALAYLIVAGSFVGFTLYVWLLRAAPISLVSTYAYVNPIVAVALGALILDEEITIQMVVAGAAVLVSVAVILRSGGASLEPGRGLFTKERPIAVAAATEPTA